MRFLVVRIAALGDIAMSTTLLGRIRAEHPDAHVAWLCGTQAEPMVELFPGVDEVISVDERAILRGNVFMRAVAILKLWFQLMKRRYDRVIILHPDPRYRVLTLPLIRARTVSASHGPGPNANPVRGRYRGDEAARLFDGYESAGPTYKRYGLVDLRNRIARREGNERAQIVLVPGGARNVLREDGRRRWPVASYRLLAEELVKRGHDVALIGDANDASFGEQFGGLPVHNHIGKLSLLETLQVLKKATVVVTHDTGPLHLARLVRAPIVALFGPTDPREFVGDDENITVIWGGKQLACRPCYDGRDYPPCNDHVCMRGISTTEVLAAIAHRMEAQANRRLTV